jgi:hypothetical protein
LDGGLELEGSIAAASSFLRDRLQKLYLDSWAPLPVGFELLLPTLLELLGLEEVSGMASYGLPAQEFLMKLREKKLARIDLSRIVAAKRQSSLLYSLEAFIGKVDFDSLSGHTVMGSMMASPAATAAVLINASKWNDDCEQYLRYVVEAGSGQGDGGVPSAFPSTYFETSWVSRVSPQAQLHPWKLLTALTRPGHGYVAGGWFQCRRTRDTKLTRPPKDPRRRIRGWGWKNRFR